MIFFINHKYIKVSEHLVHAFKMLAKFNFNVILVIIYASFYYSRIDTCNYGLEDINFRSKLLNGTFTFLVSGYILKILTSIILVIKL